MSLKQTVTIVDSNPVTLQSKIDKYTTQWVIKQIATTSVGDKIAVTLLLEQDTEKKKLTQFPYLVLQVDNPYIHVSDGKGFFINYFSNLEIRWTRLISSMTIFFLLVFLKSKMLLRGCLLLGLGLLF